MPTSSKCVRSCQPRSFGPTIATSGRSSMASNKYSSAVGAGAQSSCINQIHSVVGASTGFNECTPLNIASPKPHSRSALIIGIRADFNICTDASREPVSIATM